MQAPERHQIAAGVKVIARFDLTLVTIVPPSGYAEEMKAAAEARCAPPPRPPRAAAEAGIVSGREGAPPRRVRRRPRGAPAPGAPAAVLLRPRAPAPPPKK